MIAVRTNPPIDRPMLSSPGVRRRARHQTMRSTTSARVRAPSSATARRSGTEAASGVGPEGLSLGATESCGRDGRWNQVVDFDLFELAASDTERTAISTEETICAGQSICQCMAPRARARRSSIGGQPTRNRSTPRRCPGWSARISSAVASAIELSVRRQDHLQAHELAPHDPLVSGLANARNQGSPDGQAGENEQERAAQ
jgi:hypothetical protein